MDYKKMMTVAGALICASAMAGVESSVVGYQTKTMPAKMTMVMQQFDSLKTADGGLTLGDLIPSGTFAENGYTLGIYGGANFSKKDVEVDGKKYKTLFVYATKEGAIANLIQANNDEIAEYEEEDPEEYAEDIADLQAQNAVLADCTTGWYLRDGGKTLWSVGNMNNTPITFGEGVLIDADSSSKLTNAGEVNNGDAEGDIVIGMTGAFTMTGNVTPSSVSLADIVPGGTFAENGYTLGIYGGSNFSKKDVTIGANKYKALFAYCTKAGTINPLIDANNEEIAEYEDEDPEEYAEDIAALQAMNAILTNCETGWYLKDGGKTLWSVGAVSVTLEPGDGVLVNADSTSTLTLPSALK